VITRTVTLQGLRQGYSSSSKEHVTKVKVPITTLQRANSSRGGQHSEKNLLRSPALGALSA
jgi:hypothetical protein